MQEVEFHKFSYPIGHEKIFFYQTRCMTTIIIHTLHYVTYYGILCPAYLSQPARYYKRFSNPRGMQGWVDLVGMVAYQGAIPTERWSPFPV